MSAGGREVLVEVRFEPAGRTVWVRPGDTLLHAAGLAGVDIATGCTRGDCGTDAVRVVRGGDAVEAAAAGERATLERMGLDDGFRLSCSARLRAGGPVVVAVDAF